MVTHDPLRQLFDILVISTALFVVTWILGSPLVHRAARNPLVTLVIGFMVTLIGWLAWIGIGLLYRGYSPLPLSSTTLIILALLILVFMAAAFRPENLQRLAIVFLGGAWVFVIGVLAVTGLSVIDAFYVQENVIRYVIIALAASLGLQVGLRLLVIRRQTQQGQEGGDVHEPPGP